MSTGTFRKSPLFRFIALTVLTAFAALMPVSPSFAQVAIIMPPPGEMIHITRHFEPPQMVGLKIDLKDPFSFDFIMDRGETPMSTDVEKQEFNKLIKYFLVALAMPNKDMWVNLSPYESTRLIPAIFAQTNMGRDLLAQDYILKQFTASLMYPEDGLGKEFWQKVYAQAQARFGTTEINVNTFNKVWIVADKADVYQKGDTAFLVDSHLKVMLEQDYMAIAKNKEMFGSAEAVNRQEDQAQDAKTRMASQLVREIIIPAIEKEVNEGKSFAAVRQVYNAEIMATWFKKTLRQSLLGQVFANKAKISGQRISDPQAQMEKIYTQYLRAYKKGVFNYIREDETPDGQTIPRKYFSGGMEQVTPAMVTTLNDQNLQVMPEARAEVVEFAQSAVPKVEENRMLDVRASFAAKFAGVAGAALLLAAGSPVNAQQLTPGIPLQQQAPVVSTDVTNNVAVVKHNWQMHATTYLAMHGFTNVTEGTFTTADGRSHQGFVADAGKLPGDILQTGKGLVQWGIVPVTGVPEGTAYILYEGARGVGGAFHAIGRLVSSSGNGHYSVVRSPKEGSMQQVHLVSTTNAPSTFRSEPIWHGAQLLTMHSATNTLRQTINFVPSSSVTNAPSASTNSVSSDQWEMFLTRYLATHSVSNISQSFIKTQNGETHQGIVADSGNLGKDIFGEGKGMVQFALVPVTGVPEGTIYVVYQGVRGVGTSAEWTYHEVGKINLTKPIKHEGHALGQMGKSGVNVVINGLNVGLGAIDLLGPNWHIPDWQTEYPTALTNYTNKAIEVHNLQANVDSMKQSGQANPSGLKALEDQLAAAQQELGTLRTEVQGYEDTIKKDQQDLTAGHNKTVAAEQANAAKSHQLAGEIAQNQQEQTAIDKQKVELDQRQKQLGDKDAQIRGLQQKVASVADLEQQLKDANKAKAVAHADLTEKENEIRGLRDLLTALGAVAGVGFLAATLAGYKAWRNKKQIDAANAKLGQAQIDMVKLQGKANESDRKVAEAEAPLKNRVADLEAAVANAENAARQKVAGEVTAAEQGRVAAENALAQLQQETETRIQEAVRQALEQAAPATPEALANKQAQLRRASRQLTAAQGELVNVQSDTDKARTQADINELSAIVERLKAEVADLQSRLPAPQAAPAATPVIAPEKASAAKDELVQEKTSLENQKSAIEQDYVLQRGLAANQSLPEQDFIAAEFIHEMSTGKMASPEEKSSQTYKDTISAIAQQIYNARNNNAWQPSDYDSYTDQQIQTNGLLQSIKELGDKIAALTNYTNHVQNINSMSDQITQQQARINTEAPALAQEMLQTRVSSGVGLSAQPQIIADKMKAASGTDQDFLPAVQQEFQVADAVQGDTRAQAFDNMDKKLAEMALAAKYSLAQLQNQLTEARTRQAQMAEELVTNKVVDRAALARPVTKENVGGINLSDENLVINIKVDGAGMPLPAQYQDKAMMNLNGLTSVIRTITPLTPQNIPALYELLQ